jgi:Mn2+/Fe2+ NRAMP family transporter
MGTPTAPDSAGEARGLEKVEIPPPRGVYAEPWSPRKLLGLLAVFGPAAIVASVSIGAGETIVVVREGAWAGYGRLWLVLLSAVTKGIFVTYLLGRYAAVSGERIGDRLVRLPGPRGWLLIALVLLEMLGAPPVWAAIAKPCGDLIHHLLRGVLPGALPEPVWENLFTTAFVALAMVLGIGLPYAKMEKQQVAICCILVGGTLIGTLMVRPDLGQAFWGAVRIGHLPPAPPWAPADAREHPWLMMATTFAYVGGSVMGYIVYANWIGIHGWGLTGHEQIEAIRKRAAARERLDYLPDDPVQVRRLRQSLSPLRWDVGMGAVVLFIVTAAFMISGAAVLHPLRTRFEGWSLLTHQAHVWQQIHPALVWVYYVCIAAAMWGTLQGLPEIYGRVTHEFAQAVWPERRWDLKRIQVVLCAYVFAGAMLLVWGNVPFDLLTQIAGFLLANGAIALAMIGALYLNFLLPPAYRTHPLMAAGGIVSAVILSGFAMVSGWGLITKLSAWFR